MSPLRSEPPRPVRTLSEFFAIAHALERQASARYAELATQMWAMGLPDIAAVFERLAAEERSHIDSVEGWAVAKTGTVPDPIWLRWQPPETFDQEEAQAFASSSLASAYRALSMAVRNEERAFSLWTYIAAQAEDPAIQSMAERMAGEELHHAALLRGERRRAFHLERRGRDAIMGPGTQRLQPAEAAARIEHLLAALLSALAESQDATEQAAGLRHLAAEAQAQAQAQAIASAMVAADSGVFAQRDDAPSHIDGNVSAGLKTALRLSEQAVEIYLDAGDAAEGEGDMRRFQSLAEQSIARLVLLRRMAGGD
jgi:rubrerythrin